MSAPPAGAGAGMPGKPDGATYALIPERTWDGFADASESGKAVIVSGNAIRRVASARRLPPGIERVPLPGCTVLPGLIDAHVHFCDWMRPSFLAAGVTTVRDVGNDLTWVLGRRRYAEQHPRRSPRLLCCGPLLDGPAAHWPILGRAHADRQAIEASVGELVAQSVDAVKLYCNVTRDQLDGAAAAAHRQGKHVLAHLGGISAEEAAAAGVDEVEHLTGCAAAWQPSPPEVLDALCDALLPPGTVMCPTLVVWDRIGRVGEPAFRQDRRLGWVPPAFRQAWDRYPSRSGPPEGRLSLQQSAVAMKRCLGHMQKRGLPIIAGTDTPFPYLVPGFSLHDELALMVDGGLTPPEALRSATSVAARVLGIADAAGSLAPGRCADLLAVEGDPTRDIDALARVVAVVRSGTFLELPALRRLAGRLQQAPPDDPVSRAILGYVARAGERGP
ncbi:MAG: amidohydrolase family protein [Gemmatimonadota bacterium]